MRFEHEFTLPVPVDEVWPRLRDAEHAGTARVRLAGAQVTYKGTARVAAAADAEHRATVQVTGKEARGAGTASGAATLQLSAAGRPKTKTKVHVDGDLTVTGRAAEVDEAAVAEAVRRLLRDLLAGPRPARAPRPAPQPAPQPVAKEAAADRPPPPQAPPPRPHVVPDPPAPTPLTARISPAPALAGLVAALLLVLLWRRRHR